LEDRKVLDFLGREIQEGDSVLYNTGSKGDNGYDFYKVISFKFTPKQVKVTIKNIGLYGHIREVFPKSLLIIEGVLVEDYKKSLIMKKLKE
jgi:hypothetical protein